MAHPVVEGTCHEVEEGIPCEDDEAAYHVGKMVHEVPSYAVVVVQNAA
jgi:hypothetical protein